MQKIKADLTTKGNLSTAKVVKAVEKLSDSEEVLVAYNIVKSNGFVDGSYSFSLDFKSNTRSYTCFYKVQESSIIPTINEIKTCRDGCICGKFLLESPGVSIKNQANAYFQLFMNTL